MAAQAPQADVGGLEVELEDQPGEPEIRQRQKSLTIGAVCKALAQEFPDISISKIRYLEDQKLLTPRRTPGGYRLYTQGDVARLRTILRMQRDEFLPLRVIRQELAAGRSGDAAPTPARAGDGARAWRPASACARRSPTARAARCTRWRTCSRRPRPRRSWCASSKSTAWSRASCAAACATSTRPSARSSPPWPSSRATAWGGATCACSAPRPTARRTCLQQILAPALRSRNPQRRKEAVEALENLAAVATHLKHLLLIRDLRKIVR